MMHGDEMVVFCGGWCRRWMVLGGGGWRNCALSNRLVSFFTLLNS